jgi:uncharacterized protein (TIGR00295 family)
MTDLPSREECLAILREQGCEEAVIRHCLAVERLATGIARHCTNDPVTLELVSRGALLHDVGRSRTHGIAHAVEGANILRALGLDESLVNIVERHIGAGLTADEAAELGLPEKDYIPMTLAEKIVAQADNLVGDFENGQARMPINEAVRRARDRNLDVLAGRMFKLHTELSSLCGVDLDTIE